MTNFQLIAFTVSALLAGPMLCPLVALADDAPLCHDMPARQAVLDQGRQYLKEHPASGPSSGRLDRDPQQHRSWAPMDDVSPKEVESTPLDDSRDMDEAENLASQLENSGHYLSSNKLYMRIFAQQEKGPSPKGPDVHDLEGLARSSILSKNRAPESVSEEQLERLEAFASFRGLGLGGYGVWEGQITRYAKYRLLAALELNAQIADIDLSNAEQFYSRALAARRASAGALGSSYGEYVSNRTCIVFDVLTLALLQEKLHKVEDAEKNYEIAMHMHETGVASYYCGFCVRQKLLDLARANESTFLTTLQKRQHDYALSDLLSMYQSTGHSEDALRLFREIMRLRIPLRPDALTSMFDVMTGDDLKSLVGYLSKFLSETSSSQWFDPANADTDVVAVIADMDKRGWAEANIVCETIARDNNSFAAIPKLFKIARCYEKLKEPDRALTIYSQIFSRIQNEPERRDESRKYLSELLARLGSAGMAQEISTQALETKAKTLIAFNNDQIRRRECLGMAEKLNNTAFALERSDHFAMAQKLYQQALEIKQLNLKPDDPETANQIVDVARTAGAQKHFSEAQTLYERALAALRKNPRNASDTIAVLESYGEMLNQMKQGPKANQIYDEARNLARKIHN